jgi:hypothetical protein
MEHDTSSVGCDFRLQDAETLSAFHLQNSFDGIDGSQHDSKQTGSYGTACCFQPNRQALCLFEGIAEGDEEGV